ncbi:Uncharacterised protein [Mycobacteroides abscessus subsp. massiliense]|nr:Uncharacterised protein [Mycobacteroides abscessus subsp. massiliense]
MPVCRGVSHPVPVLDSVRPGDLANDKWVLVPDGAVTVAARGDALVQLNAAEIARRAQFGIGVSSAGEN